VLGVGRSGELLPQQAGEEHQRAERPVVDDDVLRLPIGVEREQVDVPDRCSTDFGGVILDEAFVAPGADEIEVLTVVQLAGAADDGEDGVRALHGPVQY
jgi:hypothetical protein